jgi:hypothetical protein
MNESGCKKRMNLGVKRLIGIYDFGIMSSYGVVMLHDDVVGLFDVGDE